MEARCEQYIVKQWVRITWGTASDTIISAWMWVFWVPGASMILFWFHRENLGELPFELMEPMPTARGDIAIALLGT